MKELTLKKVKELHDKMFDKIELFFGVYIIHKGHYYFPKEEIIFVDEDFKHYTKATYKGPTGINGEIQVSGSLTKAQRSVAIEFHKLMVVRNNLAVNWFGLYKEAKRKNIEPKNNGEMTESNMSLDDIFDGRQM